MLFAGPGADPKPARRRRIAHYSLITLCIHLLDARQSPGLQKAQQRLKIVRRTKAQAQYQGLVSTGFRATPERPWLGMVGFGKRGIETAQAAKTRCHGHFGNGQVGLGQQLLGEQQPLGGMHRHRRRAQMLDEQTAQLPGANMHALGQRLQRVVGQIAFINELECPRHQMLAVQPQLVTRRQLRPTAQTRAKTLGLGSGSAGVIDHILGFGRPRRAYRAAIDSRAENRGKKHPVKPRIAA